MPFGDDQVVAVGFEEPDARLDRVVQAVLQQARAHQLRVVALHGGAGQRDGLAPSHVQLAPGLRHGEPLHARFAHGAVPFRFQPVVPVADGFEHLLEGIAQTAWNDAESFRDLCVVAVDGVLVHDEVAGFVGDSQRVHALTARAAGGPEHVAPCRPPLHGPWHRIVQTVDRVLLDRCPFRRVDVHVRLLIGFVCVTVSAAAASAASRSAAVVS